jgi:hypothetical protein
VVSVRPDDESWSAVPLAGEALGGQSSLLGVPLEPSLLEVALIDIRIRNRPDFAVGSHCALLRLLTAGD